VDLAGKERFAQLQQLLADRADLLDKGRVQTF
jgi:hypothetical protein